MADGAATAVGAAPLVARETERKYDADPDTVLPDVTGPAGCAALVDPYDQLLDAVYFDTPGLDLARAGLTLRHRAGGDDAGWTLKIPAGRDSRDEVRAAGPRRARPPAELTGLVRAITRGTPVRRVASVHTRRHRIHLLDVQGRQLAEVVDDRVTARAADDEPRSWREVEVELGEQGDVAVLDGVERALLDAGLRRSAAPSKLARALGDRLPPPDPAHRRRATAGDAVLAYVRAQAEALRHWDPQVRRGGADAVHQMRVACRRMRSALQTFPDVVDRDRTRALTDELRWLAGELGAARDLEVLRDRFSALSASLPRELVIGPVDARLTAFFAEREAGAHRAALTALDGARYLDLLRDVDALLAEPAWTTRAGRRASALLPRTLARARRRVERHVAAATREGPGPERDVEMHEARKAAKRLRYAAEAAAPALGRPAAALARDVEEVQEVLGDRQDAVVARPVLREIAAQAHLNGENAFTYGVLHEIEAGRARDAEQALPAAWAATRRRFRRMAR